MIYRDQKKIPFYNKKALIELKMAKASESKWCLENQNDQTELCRHRKHGIKFKA